MGSTTEKKGGLGIVAGWLKAVTTGIMGLLSGAVIMYLTPLVNRVIEPAKPLANFGVQIDGQKATFVNQAEGTEGWWDFGDGTPLQPFAPDQKMLVHEYTQPGGYTARLVVRNLVREEHQREVTVHIDGTQAKNLTIDALTVQPLEANRYAPATFKVTATVKNAKQCVWSCGNDHALEMMTDPPEIVEKYVTFGKPGQYVIKLAAIQGEQTVEKSQVVQVEPPVIAAPLAVVQVANQASMSRSNHGDHAFKVQFPAQVQGAAFSFGQEIQADPGKVIVEAKFNQGLPPFIANPKLTVVPGGGKVVLTGEYLPAQAPPASKGIAWSWAIHVQLTQQVTGGAIMTKHGEPVALRLNVPGITVIPLPPMYGFKIHRRDVSLKLYDGNQPVWNDPKLPQKAMLYFIGKPYQVTATELQNQLRIEVIALNKSPYPQ